MFVNEAKVRLWAALAKGKPIALEPVEIWRGQTDRRMGPEHIETIEGDEPDGRFHNREALLEAAGAAVAREEARLDACGETERVVLVGRAYKSATIAVTPGRYAGDDRAPWASTPMTERVEMALTGLDNAPAALDAIADAVGASKRGAGAPGVH